jgi:hypothetical protein
MSDPILSDAHLADLDRLAAAAPAGPWRVEYYTDGSVESYAVEADAGPVLAIDPEFLEDLEAEPRAAIEAALAFVAAARTALPALLAEVRRLRGDQPFVVTRTP